MKGWSSFLYLFLILLGDRLAVVPICFLYAFLNLLLHCDIDIKYVRYIFEDTVIAKVIASVFLYHLNLQIIDFLCFLSILNFLVLIIVTYH